MLYPSEEFLYAPIEWVDHSEGYTDIRYHKSTDGIAKITINRPEVRNAFRPQNSKIKKRLKFCRIIYKKVSAYLTLGFRRDGITLPYLMLRAISYPLSPHHSTWLIVE